MTPRTGRPKLPEEKRRIKDTYSLSQEEKAVIEQAIKKEGAKESVRLWIVRKALEIAHKIIGQ